MVVADTYRWREHCGPGYDDDLGYRPARRARGLAGALSGPSASGRPCFESSILAERDEQALLEGIDGEIAAAFSAVEAAPFPDPATVGDGVWRVGPSRGRLSLEVRFRTGRDPARRGRAPAS